MTPNNFSDYYKTISNTELLDILEHQENYQPLAIDAAKKEFESRKLSLEKINEARKPLIAEQLEKEEQKKKIKAIESKVRNASNTIADALNPIQRETPTTDKLIKLISIGFFALFLFKIISDFRMFSGMLNGISKFDSSSFFFSSFRHFANSKYCFLDEKNIWLDVDGFLYNLFCNRSNSSFS